MSVSVRGRSAWLKAVRPKRIIPPQPGGTAIALLAPFLAPFMAILDIQDHQLVAQGTYRAPWSSYGRRKGPLDFTLILVRRSLSFRLPPGLRWSIVRPRRFAVTMSACCLSPHCSAPWPGILQSMIVFSGIAGPCWPGPDPFAFMLPDQLPACDRPKVMACSHITAVFAPSIGPTILGGSNGEITAWEYICYITWWLGYDEQRPCSIAWKKPLPAGKLLKQAELMPAIPEPWPWARLLQVFLEEGHRRTGLESRWMVVLGSSPSVKPG